MELVLKFELEDREPPQALYSCHFEGNEQDEWMKLFRQWGDREYLEEFFQLYNAELAKGFYGITTPQEAIARVRDEAQLLEDSFIDCQKGNCTLGQIFEPLNNNEFVIQPYQKTKAKVWALRKKMLRIYAIRVSEEEDFFVVTGGGIKLTRRMEEMASLPAELQKLEMARNFLRFHQIL